MAARLVILSLLATSLFGCGSSPPPKTLDAAEHKQQMDRLNAEVLRQEGKPVPQSKGPRP